MAIGSHTDGVNLIEETVCSPCLRQRSRHDQLDLVGAARAKKSVSSLVTRSGSS